MRLTIFAVGRMKDGPERALTERYTERLRKTGPSIGLQWDGVVEIAESRAAKPNARKSEESAQCLTLVEARQAMLVALDETGKSPTSEQFASLIGDMRDGGTRHMVLAIGGPDGHAPELLKRADRVIGLGAMTWPHQIVRALLAEQLYRAASILAGHPYHRQ